MTAVGLTQVIANVLTVFEDTKIAQGVGQHTRLGVVTYGEKATRYDLNEFQSYEDACQKLWEIDCGNDMYPNLMQ
ncbi:unnamed protein product [Cylicostephanus goldi]|uniref:VWFA domain-containing protein n=1 Tax=Cylicostephanus goldi TaxID=71465 RepID=A0A3P6TER6_CYLGO|nr:unnamed protein product [Cylicostephanus goldi]